uniref:Chromo domain-containing protein n=1 Tax=Mesocestoides corti TaxID=53468 RepID=A0A5K3FU77_MESCO
MRLSNSTKSKHDTEDGVYIVESIIGERVVKKQRFYKVRWEGFSPNEDSWEPESNLSSVRALIKKFQLKQQSISTLRQRSSKKGHSQSVIEQNSNKPNRKSLHLHKRRMTKSRVGHFEYVPQNELVAAKTKYFDDIRNGKIDLISNDLYSRVKTRRRCCADTLGQIEESNLVRPSSLIELNDCSSTYRGTPSRYSAPSTPKTFAQCTDGSIDECVSAISDPPSSSVNLEDRTQASVNFKEKLDLIGQQNSSIIHRLPRSKIVCQRHIKQSRLSRRHRRKQVRLARIPRSSGTKIFLKNSDSETAPNSLVEPKDQESFKVSEHNTAASKLTIITKTNSQQLQNSGDSSRSETDISDGKSFNMSNEASILTPPRQTVSSPGELMSLYFDLVNQCNHSASADGRNLSDFPVVKPLDDGVVLSSESELVTAINSQYWSILASQPIEKFVYDNDTSSSSRSTNSQNYLVAAVIGGEGRPFLLRRLLQPGNRSNFIDPISGWPLLVIAVYFGRVHAAQVLLESGAQPDASILVGGKLRTALGVAITTGNVDMASLLILSGANFYKVFITDLVLSLS